MCLDVYVCGIDVARLPLEVLLSRRHMASNPASCLVARCTHPMLVVESASPQSSQIQSGLCSTRVVAGSNVTAVVLLADDYIQQPPSP